MGTSGTRTRPEALDGLLRPRSKQLNCELVAVLVLRVYSGAYVRPIKYQRPSSGCVDGNPASSERCATAWATERSRWSPAA